MPNDSRHYRLSWFGCRRLLYLSEDPLINQHQVHIEARSEPWNARFAWKPQDWKRGATNEPKMLVMNDIVMQTNVMQTFVPGTAE